MGAKQAKRMRGWQREVFAAAFCTFLCGLAAPRALLSNSPPDKAATGSPSIEWVRSIHNARDVTGKGSWFKRLVKRVVGLDDRQQRLWLPHGLAIDPQGSLLVADTKARVVHLFDQVEHRYQRIHPPDSDPFAAPIAVATDAEGRIYVSDSVRSRIFVFSPKGKFLHTLGGLDWQESIFKRATGIALDARSERLYVVDTVAMEIVTLALDGRVLARFGQPGKGPGEFNYPTHIALDRDGTLWVSDSLNFRVQHFTAEGKFLSAFGSPGRGPGGFDKIKGIAVDGNGRVFVVEGRNDWVQIFDSQGRLLSVFGSSGSDKGEFTLPTGIAVDSENRIYVADSFNQRIQIFQLRPEGATKKGRN